MNILIIKLGAIGDVMRTTALLPGLKEKYPAATIDWLTAPSAQTLLAGNPLINKLYLWEERGQLGRYDLLINLEDSLEACELASNLEAGEKVGAYLQDGVRLYTPSAWFDMSLISKYGLARANELKKHNQRTYQQHMADLLGIKVSSYVFSLTPAEIAYGEKVLQELGFKKEEKIVGINTGAGKRWQLKSWGIEQTIELVEKLATELKVRSLILGGEEEDKRSRKIAAASGMPYAGLHTLRQFASIINGCQVLLTSDSLAMHFGIALQKRLVVIFGPTSATEIELYGLGSKLMPKLDCTVCYRKECDRDPSCMDKLTVEQVFAAVKKELG